LIKFILEELASQSIIFEENLLMARKKIGHIELQWACPNCGSLNPGPEKHCGNCGAPQPEDVEFTQAKRQELIKDEEKIAKAQAGADIHCPYCSARNSAGVEICHQCGGDLSEGVKRESGQVVGAFVAGPEALVTCPHCGTENPDLAVTCQQCGGSLAGEGESVEKAEQGPTPSSGLSRSRLMIIAAVVAVLILACGAYFFFANRTNPTVGVVESISWERSIPVEALVPVEYQDWQDEIPADWGWLCGRGSGLHL
jgi:rubrerythrin